MKNILIVGTGALATLFAARLSASGIRVTLLGTWQDAIDAFNRDGARLSQPDGSEVRFPVRATLDPSTCKNTDLALVLVKAWQTERAARQLEQCLPGSGLALTLQNGLGNQETLAARLGLERVILGSTTLGASLLKPGLVRAGGEGVVTIEAHPGSQEIGSLLRGADMPVEIISDARALIWGKLVINSAINPLTALLGVPNGSLLERQATRSLMAALAIETTRVASALGIHLVFDDPVAAVENVARRTAANRSSMLQDVERGAQTEIDAICGAVFHAGAELGVPAQLNWALWQLVSAMRAG